MSVSAACLIASGRLFAASLAVIASGLFDLIDGKIARLRGVTHKFGALLDSALDRYSDTFYYSGILLYYVTRSEMPYVLLTMSAWAGAFQISYVKARSEGLGQDCRVGFWERGERTVVLILGLAFHNLNMAIIFLGILTHLTALQRLLYSRFKLLAKDGPPTPPSSSPNRMAIGYLSKAAAIVLALIFLRP